MKQDVIFDVKVGQSPEVWGGGTAIWKGPRAPLSQKKTYRQKPTQYNVREWAGSLEILCWFWRCGTMNQGVKDASRNWKWQGLESPSFGYSKKNSALRTLSVVWHDPFLTSYLQCCEITQTVRFSPITFVVTNCKEKQMHHLAIMYSEGLWQSP